MAIAQTSSTRRQEVHRGEARTATALGDELGDVVDGIESVFDAHATGAIDLCPGLQRLLLDVLAVLVSFQ